MSSWIFLLLRILGNVRKREGKHCLRNRPITWRHIWRVTMLVLFLFVLIMYEYLNEYLTLKKSRKPFIVILKLGNVLCSRVKLLGLSHSTEHFKIQKWGKFCRSVRRPAVRRFAFDHGLCPWTLWSEGSTADPLIGSPGGVYCVVRFAAYFRQWLLL